MEKRDEKYYATMGQVLIEKTEQANPSKGKILHQIASNDYALAHMAKMYEQNVENSDDPELIAQHESIVIEVRGRLGQD